MAKGEQERIAKCLKEDKELPREQRREMTKEELEVYLAKAIEMSPLMRTYRIDKLTLLALEATVRAYFDEDQAKRDIPALAMLFASPDVLKDRANRLAEAIRKLQPAARVEVAEDVSYAGGGSSHISYSFFVEPYGLAVSCRDENLVFS